MNFSRLKLNRLKRLSEVLNSKEKIILASLGLVAVLSGSFTVGAWFWRQTRVVPAAGGEYIGALIGGPIYVNPILAQTNDVDTDLSRLVFSGLLKYDGNQNLVNDLAESYTVSDDQKTYTFQIKQGVTWQDKTPLTVDDIIFTVKSIQDPEFKSPLLLSLQGVDVEKIDDNSLQFILKKPFAPFTSLLTFGIIPEHIWGNVPPANFTLAEYNIKPIGSGPWVFRALTKDKQGAISSYTLERNPNYYGQKPLLDRVTFRFYSSIEDAVQAAKNKEVMGVSFVPQNLASELPKNFEQYSLLLPQYTALFFNQDKNDALKSIDDREALALAIDKNQILKEVLGGDGQTIDGPILPGSLGYDPDITKYAFDVDQAKSILDKAGWKEISDTDYVTFMKAKQAADNPPADNTTTGSTTPSAGSTNPTPALAPEAEPIETNGQTVFRKKGDSIFEINLTTVDYPENRKAAEVIEADWRAIGVKTDITLVDPIRIQKDVIKPREYEAFLYGEIIGPDPDPFPFWHSSQADDPGLNLAQFKDKEADRLLVEARGTTDAKVREDDYKSFQDILAKQLPAIFLYSPTYTEALDKKIRGFNIQRISTPADRFNNLSDWYIKTRRTFTKQ